jgi:hypothetical protein
MPEIYKHTQIGWPIILPVEAVMLFCLYLYITTRTLPALLLAIFFIFMGYLFYSLTVIGTDRTLELRFGVGLIKRRFNLRDITSIRPYRTRFWHGWGIHRCPDGLIYNVSGFDAVQITLLDGRKYIIGTNDRHRLMAYIEEYRRL